MKYIISLFTIVILLSGCKEEDKIVAPQPDEPSVKIINPVNNQAFIDIDSVTIEIEASDPKGIANVELFINNNKVKEFPVKPYKYLWDTKNLPDSSLHAIYARAYNTDGKMIASELVNVTVNRLTPSNLVLFSLGKDNVHLSWNDNSLIEDGFVIQLSTDSINFNTIAERPPNTTEATVSNNFDTNVKYYFRVGAKKLELIKYTNIVSYKPVTSCPDMPTVSYAGKTYNTVLIGEQCWLKENLNVGTRIDGSQAQTNNGVIEKYCYDNNPANCDTYGGLYQWDEVMQYNTTPGTRGICPPGWHIPTYAEIQTLKAAVNNDDNALKAVGQGTGDGAGTNTSGFSALLAGSRRGDSGFFYYLGYYAYFWSSTETPAATAGSLSLYYSGSGIYLNVSDKDDGFSVRCVQD